ncbi:MAG: hypothetical protein ACYC3W_02380 [Candidatus Nanopelagicales bacterium]
MSMPTPDFARFGQIIEFADWAEKSVRCVIERPSGPRAYTVSAVVVFDDDSWSTLIAHGASACEDDAYLDLGHGGHRITDYLSAQDLLQAGMVNHAQFEHLKSLEESSRKADLMKQAERLRAQAEKALADAQKIEATAQV